MKIRTLPRIVVLLLAAALLLLVGGAAGCLDALRELDELYRLRDAGQEEFGAAALQLCACVFILTLGICILAVTCIRTVRRRREERAVREKTEKMERLIRQTKELAHHQRLETIGTLTASIAHEFNNLLTPIMGYSMMALEKIPEEETEVYDGLVEIYEISRKAKNIISRLSDLARRNTDEAMRPIAIDELVKKTLEIAAPAKPKNVQIRLDLNCWDQRFEGNEIQINQLLLNLILNSFHAMGEGEGILTIHTSFDDETVQIRIEDTGCGIPEEIIDRIFEPFFTTKETGKGTGLGLAIAAQVAEEHHGRIEVKSKVGTGTAMTIRLSRFPEHL